jgi:carbon-monoxide dehydrogenase medium subunit
MYPQAIEHYFQPRTLADVASLCAEHGERARIIAGGQSLVPQLKARSLSVDALIDINRVAALDTLHVDAEAMHCGALLRFANASLDARIQRHAGALADAAAAIGDRQVRNRGTVLGSVLFAAHWGDIAPAASVLNAQVELMSTRGQRSLPLAEVILAPGRTCLAVDEFATGLRLPLGKLGSAYLKHGRVAQDRATLGVAAAITLDADGVCRALRVAVGGLASHPFVGLDALESLFVGQRLSSGLLQEAGHLAAARLAAQDDELASAAYRRQLLCVYLPRAIELAAARGTEGTI